MEVFISLGFLVLAIGLVCLVIDEIWILITGLQTPRARQGLRIAGIICLIVAALFTAPAWLLLMLMA